MNGYLLDTHSAIWFFNGDAKLSKTAHQIIRDRSNYIFLSITTVWEVAIKLSIGKLDIVGKTSDFIRDIKTNKILVLPIRFEHLTTYEKLPMHHRDPFDRLLVATAVVEQLSLITADSNIAQYDVPVIW